jgi:protein-L-isoaspartate(D-aspartate) O-methyltransferase
MEKIEPEYQLARENMVRSQLIPRGIRDTRVLQAMGEVPREKFVPDNMKLYAYEDSPLAIGMGQTISQPYIVALMTEALVLTGTEKTLEIGTGSGYQAAILSLMCKSVYSVERIAALSENAKNVLNELGYKNIFLKIYDGTLGWSENAPYDAIMVTAGAPVIPDPLIAQLKEGGRLVVPVGDRISQELIKVVRKGESYYQEDLGGVRFVNLIGEYGWKE